MPTDYNLYVLAIPEASRSQTGSRAQQNISELGLLQRDLAAAEAVSSNPNQQTLNGYYAGQYAEKMATELEELTQGTTSAAPAPLAGQQSSTPLDGYYLMESADVEPPSPQERSFWRYQLSLTKKGTSASHKRSIETDVSQVDHPFGNDQTAYVGVPTTASKVQWFDRSQGTADPTLADTRAAELGDVEIYDADAAPFDNPTLVYDLAYADEGPTDVRVWDERGVGAKLDANGDLQWAKVFVSSHDYSGECIVDNGLVRLRFDQSTPALTVERWDDANTTWTSQSLGTSDWEFWDLDVREVGLASVYARVEFRDTTQSPTATETVDCWVKRGWQDPLWGNDAAFPTGLEDLLSPVAATSIYEPGETKGLVERGEL